MTEPATRKQRALTSDKVKPNSPAARIIDRFGGLSRFCQLTDFAPGTVHGWMVSGLIPARTRETPGGAPISYTAWILAVAQNNQIELEAGDFVDAPGELVGG